MRNLQISCLFLIFLLANFFGIDVALVSGQCQRDQQSLLLQIKNSLIFDSNVSVKLEKWSQSRDCCKWGGVECDVSGRVIGLNLSSESISAGIENATGLFNLQYLQSLNLACNRFDATQIPSRLVNIRNLAYLNLSHCGLSGTFPGKILQVPTLKALDLSNNKLLQGSLPQFPRNTSLQTLMLQETNFSGTLPVSIGNLKHLSRIELAGCNFAGKIPISMSNLPQLVYLDFSNNNFTGQVPSFRMSKGLSHLDLSHNGFRGEISSIAWEQLLYLLYVDLRFNSLNGRIPSSLLALPSLEKLQLANNHFRGQVPNLKNQSKLCFLDLSDNQISGDIPNWVWQVTHLNLSHNYLVGLQEPRFISNLTLTVLDLHSNQLQGKIPQPPSMASYVDYSSNYFTSIPADIGNFLSSTTYLSLSNNRLTGDIPESICNATKLLVLDFSNNELSGKIPTCLITRSETLGVLNFRGNRLNGTLSDTFPGNCGLQTLNLNGNLLEGPLPKSLANCTKLEVLDLGNNWMRDTFPCWLKNVNSLRVLVLRSNEFYGKIDCPEINGTWSMLQIVDLASNNFSGKLPGKRLTAWEAMMVDEDKAQSNLKHLRFEFQGLSRIYYQNAITITMKGLELELVKILTIFTAIDLSNNNFQGPIPEEIGLFKSLYILNMSHNSLTGPIPSSIGNLRKLESLDLSVNKLTGEIPSELANLNFLSVLNLSYNHFMGRIPSSTQLQSFPNSSFEGNAGLCGSPLSKKCTNPSKLQPSAPPASINEIDWKFILMATGFAIGFGAVVTPLTFSKKVNKWYDDRINKFLR